MSINTVVTSPSPDAGADLPDDAEPRWISHISHASAVLTDEQGPTEDSVTVPIVASNFGIHVGMYLMTTEEALDLIANLADALQEHAARKARPRRGPEDPVIPSRSVIGVRPWEEIGHHAKR